MQNTARNRWGFFILCVVSLVILQPQTVWAHAFGYFASTPITPPGEFLWWWPISMLLLVIGTYLPLRHSLKWSRLFSIFAAFIWVVLFTIGFFWFGNAAANSSTAPPSGLGMPCGAFWGRTFAQVGSIFVGWNLLGLVLFLVGPGFFLLRTGRTVEKGHRLSYWLWGISVPASFAIGLTPFIVTGAWVHGWGGGYVTGRCQDQLGDIHVALVKYALDHNNHLPVAKDYAELYPQIEPYFDESLKSRGWRGTTDVCVIGKAWDRTPKSFVWDAALSGKEILRGYSWDSSDDSHIPLVEIHGDSISTANKPWVDCPYIPSRGRIYRDVKLTPEQIKSIRLYRGSRLTLLDVNTGVAVPLSDDVDEGFQTPQWSGDGKSIYFGSLWKIRRLPIGEKIPVTLEKPAGESRLDAFALYRATDFFAVGTWKKESGGIILLFSAGDPSDLRQISSFPGKMHGWSPDGKRLLYAGKRDPETKEFLRGIYSVSIDDGEETRWSSGPGKDDGPEYTPDGEAIWFCSDRSGTMQLWQMKTKGGDPQQMTHEEWHCFCPHISPDGKRVVYLTCPKEAYRSDSYSPDKDELGMRIMPIAGGESKELISFRGTLDSFRMSPWSPDGTKIVFVERTFRR